MEMASARFICVILVCVLFLLKGEGGSKVPITRLKSAVKKGAVCLDGSPPAYHFDKGTGKGANSWLVHLEGGAWCETVEKCMSRTHATNGLGSSFLMNKTTFRGILSKARKYNPNFYNWNRILVRYCDGSSFTGDVEQVNWGHSKLYFRGARIFDVIVEDLLQKGMINASNALLSGNSAGGLASIIHCDKFQAFLPFTRRVKCFSDAGYFMHARDISGKYHYQEVMFDRVVSLHGSIKNLPRGCTSRMKPSLCFYPQFIAPTIHTPLFILNSAYDVWQVPYILALTNIDAGRSWVGCQWNTKNCTSSQIKILEGFRAELVHEVISASHSSTGFFINSCYTHCQSLHQKKWLGNPTSTVNNKSISEAVGEWYYDRSVVQLIDHQYRLPHWCVIDKSEPNPDNNYTWN